MLLADVGGVSGVVNTLKEFKVSDVAVANIKAFLQEQEEVLAKHADDQDVADGSMFGTRWSGEYLGTHHQKADAFLTNTIVETAAALNVILNAVKDFGSDVGKTAADDEARSRVLINQVSSVEDVMDGDQNTPAPEEGA